MKINWSEEQQAIFRATASILNSTVDLVVEAYAGTGKTTTMIEAIRRFVLDNPGKSIVMCAFNKKNAQELQERLDELGLDWKTARASTLHSLGYSAIRYTLGNGVQVETRKGWKIAKGICGGPEANRLNVSAVAKCASLAKGMLVDMDDRRALTSICYEFDIQGDDIEASDISELASIAMRRAYEDTSEIDFDDMIWFPHVHDCSPFAHDVVVVDEAQDMNPAQLAIARKAVKHGGRMIAIGDSRQAIYGWRGADSQFMSRLITESNAKTLPLTTTFRCGQKIVDVAKKYVPEYRAHEINPEGIVRDGSAVDEARAGDFILSRTNAPLMPMCLRFIRDGEPAYIQGRDVGASLIALVKIAEKQRVSTAEQLVTWLDRWRENQCRALDKAEASETAYQVVDDKRAVLVAVADEYDTTERIKTALGTLFDDDRPEATSICLSTVHRAKGLERDRVFILEDTFSFSGDQESNVMYVAITRAKNELVWSD